MGFTVRTPDGLTITLEQGDENSGMTHIFKRHFADFKKKQGSITDSGRLEEFLRDVLQQETPTLMAGGERHYRYATWALLIIIGSRSQVVTAMPLSNPSDLRETGVVNNESRLQVLSTSIGATSDGIWASEDLSPQERIERAMKQHYALDFMKVAK